MVHLRKYLKIIGPMDDASFISVLERSGFGFHPLISHHSVSTRLVSVLSGSCPEIQVVYRLPQRFSKDVGWCAFPNFASRWMLSCE